MCNVCIVTYVQEMPLDRFTEEYLWVSLRTLNHEVALLNTKWDESIAPITQRFIETLWDGLSPIETGDVILFQVIFPRARALSSPLFPSLSSANRDGGRDPLSGDFS